MVTKKQLNKILLGSIPFVAILLFWSLSYIFNWIPHWMLPSPISVFSGFITMLVDGTLLKLILISLLNLIPAFVIAGLLAIILGTLIGTNRTIRKIFTPFFGALNLIPSLAWMPFIILFFGFTRQTIWIVIFISSFMKIIFNVITGVRNVNPNWILAAKNLGLSKLKIITKVILPGAFPEIITGLRLGFGSAWRSLIGAEMLVVAIGGLGKFIWNAQWMFAFDKVLIGIILIGLIGLIVEELVFRKIENAVTKRWGIEN